MFKTEYEGVFSSLDKNRIESACQQLLQAVDLAQSQGQTAIGGVRKKTWFGSGTEVEIGRGLRLYGRVINDGTRTVRFVNSCNKKYWCAPDGVDANAVPPPPNVRVMKSSVNAMVYPAESGFDTDNLDHVIPALNNFGASLSHAGSGMRVFLYQGFFNSLSGQNIPEFQKDLRWLTLIIGHELTHKILNTHDICYGPANNRDLAISDPSYTLLNADSWACFITSFIWPELLD